MEAMNYANVLDCTPGLSPSNEPIAILTLEATEGITERIVLRQRDYRRLLECLKQVAEFHQVNSVGGTPSSTVSATAEPDHPALPTVSAPDNPNERDKHLATLPTMLVSLPVKFPDQTEGILRILGGYRSLPRGPYLLLCRDDRVSPPRHLQVRFGKDFLGFNGWSIVKGNDRPERDHEVYLEWWHWPWFIGLKARTKFLIKKNQRCRKLSLRDLNTLLDRHTQHRKGVDPS